MGETVLGIVDGIEHLFQMIDEKGCCCCWCLHPGMADHVEDTLVAVVADAGDDGQGEVGDILCQCEGVEAAHIARCTTTANNHYAIKLIIIYALEGIDDALFDLFTLHDGGE